MRKNGGYIAELGQRIPLRNIDFYVQVCRAMSMIDVQERLSGEAARELKKIKNLALTEELRTRPQTAFNEVMNYFKGKSPVDASTGMKLLGRLMVLYLRKGEFNKGTSHFSTHPFNFLSYSVVEDLKLLGHGPCYSLVENFLDELVLDEVIDQKFYSLQVRTRSLAYGYGDMAAIFLGYSLISKGALLPLVPFSGNTAGFVSHLVKELKKLLPPDAAENSFFKRADANNE
jgi:hypothetical protein